MKPKSAFRSFLILASSSLLAISSANAQATYYWDSNSTTPGFGTTTGTWGTSNFLNTDATGGAGGAFTTATTNLDTLNFGTASLNYAQGSVAVAAGGVSVSNIVIGAGQTQGITLGTAGNTVTIQSGITKNAGSGIFLFASPVALAANQTWTNNSPPATVTAETESLRASVGINYGANTFTIEGIGVTGFSGGAITGSGDFIKNGTGTVVFTAENTRNNTATFTGKVFLNGGVARFQDVNSVGSGNIQINGGILEGRFGSALTRVQGIAANEIQITGGVSGFSGQGTTGTPFNIGNVTWGSATFNPTEFVLQSATTNVTGNSTFSSAIDLNGADRTIRSEQTSGTAGSGTFSGVISNSTGTAGVIKTGVGHHIFSNAGNIYNGNTTVNQGILTATVTGALPGFNVAGRVTVADGATMNVRTGAWTAANIDSLRTNATWSANGSRLGLDTTAGVFTYASNITEALSVYKIGNNNLTLTGANTYTGKTYLGGGSVLVSSFGNIADASSPLGTNSTIEFLAGGNLSFTGSTVQSSDKIFNIAQGDATLRADGTGIGAITLTANINPTSTSNKTLQLFGANANANTISGNISNGAGGVLSLTKNLAGTWVLSGNNSYTGQTTVSAGRLEITGTNTTTGPTALSAGSTVLFRGAASLGSGNVQVLAGQTGTIRYQSDGPFSVSNGLQYFGTTANHIVDRATPGSGTGLNYIFNGANPSGSNLNDISAGTTVNFSAGSNITSGTPTITITNGIRNQSAAGAATNLVASGVNVIINGITTSNRTRIWSLQGTSTGNEITGGITGGGSTVDVTKSGIGTWKLSSSANNYTGTTTITGGTLVLGANNVLPNTTNVTIGTATLDADTRADTAGTLDVTGTAVINLGTGAALAFADSDAVDWTGGTLNVTGTLGATSLRFGTDNTGLSLAQLALISVNGAGLGTYVLDGSGYLIPGGGGPGPLDNFLISAISSPQTVGTPITGITLTARDASNATVTSFSGTVNFGGTGGFTGTSATFTAGVLSGVSVTPANPGSGLTFTVTDGVSGKTGTATFNIQTQYAAWAGGALFDADANNDGVSNGLAFLLGASSPTGAVTPPTVTQTGGDLILNFNCLADAARGSATLRVEHSSDLGILDAWTATTAEVPDATNAVPDNNVTFAVAAGPVGPPALNSVTATINSAAAAGNKLFGRLKAVQP